MNSNKIYVNEDLVFDDNHQQKFILRNSEIIFEKSFNAAVSLAKFHEELIPIAFTMDMHMDDIYESIFYSASDIEIWIKNFVQQNRVILPINVYNALNMACRTAGSNKPSHAEDDICNDCKVFTGEEIYDYIRMSAELMIQNIYRQTGINPNNYIGRYCQNNS